MHIKIHQSYRTIVALADTELIGKKFEEGRRQIEVRPNFFKGEEKNKKETIKILQNMQKEDATFNIVGKESVATALEAGIIKQEGIFQIDDIPVALVLM
ncbi:MAG: hypothetical protein RL557_94 [archaeon]|jgi:hypothetical protein